MPIEFTDIVTFSAGGAVGFFAKTFISHKLATARNFEIIAINEFNEAAAKFRTCFTEQIRVLQEDGGTNPLDFLSRAYIRHWNAVIEFSPVLSTRNQKRLNEQWKKYQQAVRPGKVAYFSGCESRPGRLASHRVASPWIDGSNPRD